jgi:3',5'-cyclic AMP phosphodiesterase CpdA
MAGLDQEMLRKLREALLKCDEFHSPRVLFAVMGIEPLSHWQTRLPSADSVGERVDLTIHYLVDKHHINGKNALVLLLEILGERYSEIDERHSLLLNLANELQSPGQPVEISTPIANATPQVTPEEKEMDQQTRNALFETLCNRISPSELRAMVFKVLGPRAYDNLLGGTHTERSISFLEAIERRQKGGLLLEELRELRPDITLGKSKAGGNSTRVDLERPSILLTWLHLSDLHFRESRNYDETIVLKALLSDVEECMDKDSLRPDFIAMTGDLAFSGKPAEYELARSFFDELLQITKLPRERLFVVPGNHDVNRGLVTNGAKAITNALIDRGSVNSLLATDADRQLVMARFKPYAKFVNDYFGGHITFNNKQYFSVRSLLWPGPRIMLLGLNSAWVCVSDKDKTPGVLLGERQTRAALELAESGDLKIALLHHPLDWLREFDQNDSAAMLLDNCDFILHGHLHRTATTQLSGPDTRAMVIGGGACYETRQYPNMYNFVRLDLGSGTGTVCLRRYSDERGGFWAKDVMTYKNVPDGEYEFTLEN